MIQEEHIQTARDFLVKSDNYFTEGDVLQGSEKLWGAAAHSIIALAQQRGWKYGNHYAIRQVVRRIEDELDDERISLGLIAAEKFHANFYHEFMDDDELDMGRPAARRFVERILALTDEQPDHSIDGLAE